MCSFSVRKRCIHSEPRFDFLKELASEVPDLQGDTDEKESAGAASSSGETVAPVASTAAPRPTRIQRQLSTPRTR